jgi:tetratricopeptide (TPR) repeat protein
VQGRYFWRKRNEDAIRKAIECFETAIELDPNYALAYSGLADAWSVLPNYSSVSYEDALPKARKAVEKALALDDRLGEAHASMGLMLSNSEKYEDSEKELLRAIELDPGYAWSHIWYSNTLSRLGRREESLERLQVAYELDPLNLVTLVNLANKRKDAREWEEAERLFRQVLELETMPLAAARLGDLLQTLGRYQEAIALYERVIERFPADGQIYPSLSYLHANRGNLELALNVVDQLYGQNGDDTTRLLSRGDVYYWVLRYDEAIDNYRGALSLKPGSETALEDLVWVCTDAGRFEDAIKYADRYVELWPERPWSYRLRCYANAVRGDLDKVLEDVEKIKKLDPNDRSAYWMEALAKLYLGDCTRAMDIIVDNYLSSDNANDRRDGTYAWARLLAARGQFNQALEYTDSCLVADSLSDLLYNVAWARQLRMYIYEEMGDLNRALTEARRVAELYLEVQPGEAIAWKDYLVQILAMRGDFDEAEEVMSWLKTEAEGRALTSCGYYYAQGAMAFVRGDYEMAIKNLRLSADSTSNRSSDSYFQAPILLARAYFEAGQLDKSIDLYQTLLSNTSVDRLDWVVQVTKARYHLGRAYERAGRTREAIAQYEEFLHRWGDADVRLASVDDARARLAKLKSGGS